MAYEGRDFELEEDRHLHLPSASWGGCPNCGYPINMGLAIARHSSELLGYVENLLRKETSGRVRRRVTKQSLWYNEMILHFESEEPEFADICAWAYDLPEETEEPPKKPRSKRTKRNSKGA